MKEDISIVVAGDFVPREDVARAASHLPQPADLLGPAAALFREADLAVANLEYPLTRAETPIPKYGPSLKGDAGALAALKAAGVGLLTLANNHILDFGAEGVADTIEACRHAGIATVGAGLTPEDASKAYCVTIKGRRIAVVAVCESEFNVFSETHGGGACGLDPVRNYYTVKKAKENADLVIVLIHGGMEKKHYPSPNMVRTCRFFADIGASAVVCHHPHYVQGHEVYKGVPILYSLGHLFYTAAADPERLEVPVAELRFDSHTLDCSVQMEFFRVSLEQMKLVELGGDALRAARERFAEYSRALETWEAIRCRWDACCAEEEHVYLCHLLLVPNIMLRITRRLGLQGLIRGYAAWKRRSLLRLENMIRCETHREAVLDLLEKRRGG